MDGSPRSRAGSLVILGLLVLAFSGLSAAATDIEITSLSAPSRAGAGEEITFTATVENAGDQDIPNATVNVTAWGQSTVSDPVELDAGAARTFEVAMTVPKRASGPETVQVEALARSKFGGVRDRDVTTTEVTVRELGFTMNVVPDPVEVGRTVSISGIMSSPGVSADLYIGETYEATITSDPTGHYSYSFRPSRAGTVRIVLRSGSTVEEEFLHVDPTVNVATLSAPDTVAIGDIFDVCADITASGSRQATARLLIDGDEAAQRTVTVDGRERTCFSTSLGSSGDHTVTVAVAAGDATSRLGATVTAVEEGVETSVFPQRLTLQQGQAGIFQVEIVNDRVARRTFTVSVPDLANITDAGQRQVSLAPGERRTVAVRVVPPEVGTYRGTVRVAAGNVTYATSDVTVVATENPALRNPVIGTVASWIGGITGGVEDMPREQRWLVAGAVAVLVLGAVWWRRRQRSSVIEPQW